MFEWLAREGGIVLSWWLLVTLAGAAALPLSVRLLGGLPDRGYTLARALGLLLTGFTFWILASFGFLRNTGGSMLLAWLVFLCISLLIYARRRTFDWRAWWQENRPVVITGEILFAVLLIGWALVRAHQKGIWGTEKPMDLMFISSIMRSEVFPPNDGWLAGYSISYYYFGYLMMAMLSTLSGIPSTVGYNMATAMVFALTGLTTFGVAYNLVRSRAVSDPIEQAEEAERRPSSRSALVSGLLAAMMLTLMGNFQTALVEIPYESRSASESYLRFWGTQERDVYPERAAAIEAGIPNGEPVTLSPGRTDPAQWEYWWWFRASRVLQDYDLSGAVEPPGHAQPIDEFPQFSFLLADNHPHVMALPFVLLALGLALNRLLTGRDPDRAEIVLIALCIGGLVFLNTWDGPIYLLALLGAEGLRRLTRGQGRLVRADWIALIRLGAAVGVLLVVFYLPFLVSFRSQASGLLPNLVWPTYFPHFFLMFGPFLLILLFFLIVEAWRAGRRMNWGFGFQAAGLLFVGLLVFALALVAFASLVPELQFYVTRFTEPYGGLSGALPLVLARRLLTLPTTLVLLAGIVLIAGRIFPRFVPLKTDTPRDDRVVVQYPVATGFALMITAVGIGLALVPEFFYLRDNFGTRINTIFKFYYQVWVVFSIAAAYAIYTILADDRLPSGGATFRGVFGLVAIVALAMGMIYPLLGIHSRMFLETGRVSASEAAPLTLDGGTTLLNAHSDYQSIMCWQQLVDDADVVVAEATGPAYNSGFGRVAALTGAPILLGWENHERQWRGPVYDALVQSRPTDIEQLYTDPRWEIAEQVIDRYGVDYIFYGVSERSQYGSGGEEKFIANLEALCPAIDESGTVRSVFYHVATYQQAAFSQR